MTKRIPKTVEDYFRQHQGLTPEEAARLDATTPPSVPETRPEYQTRLPKSIASLPRVDLPQFEQE